MRHLEIGDTVVVKDRFEVSPAHYISEGHIGEVVDETFPHYYLIQFPFGQYWIDEDYLMRVI